MIITLDLDTREAALLLKTADGHHEEAGWAYGNIPAGSLKRETSEAAVAVRTFEKLRTAIRQGRQG